MRVVNQENLLPGVMVLSRDNEAVWCGRLDTVPPDLTTYDTVMLSPSDFAHFVEFAGVAGRSEE
jgi:hypothetical protein